jgi:GntR family transcriptional regulator
MDKRRQGRPGSAVLQEHRLPLYYQLKTVLRAKIESGEILPRQQFPTELELSRAYQISRSTVRQALGVLARAGWLARTRGRGTFVTRPSLPKLTGFTEDLLSRPARATIQVLTAGRRPAPARVARLLGVPNGSQVVHCERVHAVDDQPVAVGHHYLPSALGDQLSASDLTQPTLFRVLERKLGLALQAIQHGVEATKAPAEIAARLGLGLLEPVLYRAPRGLTPHTGAGCQARCVTLGSDSTD